jgi:hypothetical protein
VAGVEGTLHVPFSRLDISQIEQRLGSFSDNPTRYHKEFLCLTWAYALTCGDIYNIIDTQRIKKREYGRQQTNTLINSMNSIPTDIPLPLRQYLRLSLDGAIKIGTQDQIPQTI